MRPAQPEHASTARIDPLYAYKSSLNAAMLFRQITDHRLSQYAYLIACQKTGEAILIDPERDVDRYLRMAADEGVTISAVLETHIHADFLSGARELAEQEEVRLYLSGEGGEAWSYVWADSDRFDVRVLRGGDSFSIGQVAFDVLHTPGHTPEHLSLLVTDRGGGAVDAIGILTGDFVFVGDLGRPDLLESAAGEGGAMEPSARRLYNSARRFLQLPDQVQVWPGHGAGSACGKHLGAVPQSTVGYERDHNAALAAARGERDEFVQSILSDQIEPPLYFARMKRLNRDGPPALGAIPEVRHLTVKQLEALEDDVLLVDARTDRKEFMRRHARRALFAPFDRKFPTVVGSLIEDPETTLVLVIEHDEVDEAVRCLRRIGFDHVAGFVRPSEMEAYLEGGAELGSIERIDFEQAERLLDHGFQVVDVRYGWEFDGGHMPGAIHAPFTRLPEKVADLPKDEPLIVHCSVGTRSAPSASYLARLGWNVRYVDDAFERWAAERPEKMTR